MFYVPLCGCETHHVTVDLPCLCCLCCFSSRPVTLSDGSRFVSVGPGVNSGTTATVALLRDGIELVVASVGDSRAMLCRKGKALKLTVDHTPERRDEKERWVVRRRCRKVKQFS